MNWNCVYIYAFSICFHPKQLLHSRYTFNCLNPWPWGWLLVACFAVWYRKTGMHQLWLNAKLCSGRLLFLCAWWGEGFVLMVLVWKETVEAYHRLNSVTEWMPASGLCFSTCCFRLHNWISAREYKVKEENTIWSSHILGADSCWRQSEMSDCGGASFTWF